MGEEAELNAERNLFEEAKGAGSNAESKLFEEAKGTGSMGGEEGSNFIDLRDAIRPKRPLPDSEFDPRPYYQVRAARHGFLPNLSVLDLLFNEGPEGIFWL